MKAKLSAVVLMLSALAVVFTRSLGGQPPSATVRVTLHEGTNLAAAMSPDGRTIAIDLLGTLWTLPAAGGTARAVTEEWLDVRQPAWSPDGTRIAFTSNRDGNPELYVMNRDGSGVRRLTTHPAIDTTPTWSPTGLQIAFTSDRSGSPAIYVVGNDGLNLRRISTDSYCDRPTWSPAPFNELAFVCGNGRYDIKIYDFAEGQIRQITFGEGSNESPAYSPNGRHLAFTSTRAGRVEVFTMGRDGKNVKQVTRDGNNYTPAWSN